MACDVRIVALLLLSLHCTTATDFGLKFSINPAADVVVPPNTTVSLHCQTNLPSDTIHWHLNHAPLPHQHLLNNNDHTSESNNIDRTNSSDAAASHSVLEQLRYRRTNSDANLLLVGDGGCRNDSCARPPYRVISYDNHTSSLQIHVGNTPKLYEQQLGIYQCIATLGSISLASSASRVDVAVLAPFPARDSSRVVVAEGAAVRIPCPRPHSRPPALLSFTRDQQPLLLDHDGASVSPSGDLLLASVSPSLVGVYRCSATNTVLNTTVTDPATTSLSLQHTSSTPAAIISPSPGLTIVTEGEDVRLYCLSNQLPSRIKMQWTLEGSSPSSRQPANSSSLLDPKHLPVHESLFASLGTPDHTPSGGGNIQGSSTSGASVFPEHSVLYLPSVSSNASGMYICSGREEGQSDALTSVVELYVQTRPRVVSGLVSASLSEGQRLQVRCEVSGRPAPLLTWLSNGRRLVQGNQVTIMPDGSLIVKSVSKQLAGVLQCFGHNAAGSVSSHAFYTVTPNTVRGGDARHRGAGSEEHLLSGGRRHSGLVRTVTKGGSAPSSPTVSRAADDAVQLTWTPPRRRHRLLFYKVQYRVVQPKRGALPSSLPGLPPFTGSGGRQWRTDDTTIHAGHNSSLVAGLTPGLTYKFRVAAVFANQDDRVSPASARFLLTRSAPLRPPSSPPRIQSVWRENSGQLGVSWQYSGDTETDGFIIGYREAGTDMPYTKLRYLGGRRRRLSLAEVPPGPAYDLHVQAFNMAGSSPPSPARTVARAGSDLGSDQSELLIPESLQGSASNLQSSSAPENSEQSVVVHARKNTSRTVPFPKGSKTSKDGSSKNRNNVQLLHANDYVTQSQSHDENNFPMYEDRSFEYQDYYEMESDENDSDLSEEDISSEEDKTSGRRGGGGTSSLSSLHLLVALSCVLLGLLALVLVSYLLYARREKRGYGPPVEQFNLQSTCAPAPADGRLCLQSLGSPEVSPSRTSALYQQEPSPLTMPD